MNITFNATFCVDLPISIPDIINSDAIGEYKAALDCAICDAAMTHLCDSYKGDILLNYAYPSNDDQDAIDEYGKLLENWITEYPKQLAAWQEKINKKYESS